MELREGTRAECKWSTQCYLYCGSHPSLAGGKLQWDGGSPLRVPLGPSVLFKVPVISGLSFPTWCLSGTVSGPLWGGGGGVVVSVAYAGSSRLLSFQHPKPRLQDDCQVQMS